MSITEPQPPTEPSDGEQLDGGQRADEADEVLSDIPVIPPHVNREIFQAALRATLLMLGALTVLGVAVGGLVAGSSGVWGALMGVGITLVFSGTTIASVLYTVDKSPSTMMAVILGAWVAKMAVLLVVLAIVGQLDFYNRVIFGIVVMIGALGSAILDMYSVVKGREPYLNPR